MKIQRLAPALIALIAVILTLSATSRLTQAAPTGGVVGTGTPASCTDAALNTALTGGGTVTFNCGGPATLTLTLKTISANTTIDGGNAITLTTLSSWAQQLFSINANIGLTLTNLTIANVPGASFAFPIVNNGRLILTNTSVISTYYFINSTANSTANIINSTFISNTGTSLSANGPFTLTNSQVRQNSPGGSGMFMTYTGVTGTVDNSDFISNSTATAALLYGNGGSLAITNSRFQQNTGTVALIGAYGPASINASDFISNTTVVYSTRPLVISNSRFYWNHTTGTASVIYMHGFGWTPALTLTNSSLMSNTAAGGAIYNYYNGPALISNTVFFSNTSTNSAGALYLDYPGTVQVYGSTFQQGMGGGIYVNGSASPLIISDSQFISNTSQNSAGAIDAGTITVTHSSFISNTSYNGSGALDASRQAYITGSTFLTNTGSWGGAMELSSGGFGPFYDVVANSVIKGNTSTSQGGGGIRATQHLTLIDSEVSDNKVLGNSYGGGIYFANGYVLTVTNSVIQNNIVTGTSSYGGGVYLWGQGGYITNSTILSNSAGGGGGVYQNNGPLHINNTVVQSNTATTFFGGGLESHTDSLTLTDVNVSGNRNLGGGGQGYGGGLYVASFANPLKVNRSLFYNNVASHANSQGGGIYLTSPAFITNTTLYSNSAANGGTGFNYNTSYVITLTNNTILSNTNASGVITSQLNNAGTAYRVTLVNTLISGSSGGNCAGNKILSLGHNLSSDASCALTATLDLSSTTPLLGAFANNGGFTHSFMPSANSPLVNAGDGVFCPGDDQRGVGRPIGSACDIGSIESPHLTPQTISFAPLADRVVNEPPFIITATASSGLPVAFTYSGVCSVSGSTVTLSGVTGSCTLTATQSGDAIYAPAPNVARTFNVTALTQTITFEAIPHHPVSDPPFVITATASSGLSVTFTSLTTSTCAVTGTLVTPLSGGACTIRASQPGNALYAPAPNVERSFNVQYLQLIFWNPLLPKVLGDPPFALNAQAGSALPVSYASLTPSTCTVSGITVTLVAGGQCTLRASQPGNAEFAPAPEVDQSFTVLLPQTITFNQPGDYVISHGPFVVTATASSGLTVTFSSLTTATCTTNVFGLVTPVSAGVCTLRAAQTGNGVYAAAPVVDRSLNLASSQTITFAAIPDHFISDAPFSIAPTASSGLSVTVTSLTTSVCTIDNDLVTLVAPGQCTLRASQPGNGTIAPAPDVERSFMVRQHMLYLPLALR